MFGHPKKASSIGQWNGRSRSSRSDQPVLPYLQLTLVREETRPFLDSQDQADHVRRGVALFLVFSLLSMVVVLYVVRFQQGLAQSLSKVVGVCALVLLTLILGLLLNNATWHAV